MKKQIIFSILFLSMCTSSVYSNDEYRVVALSRGGVCMIGAGLWIKTMRVLQDYYTREYNYAPQEKEEKVQKETRISRVANSLIGLGMATILGSKSMVYGVDKLPPH